MKPTYSIPHIFRRNFKAKNLLMIILVNLIFSGTFIGMSSYVYAGSESSGAGNDLAIKFINATKSAISYVNTHENEFPEFKEKNLATLLIQASQNLTVSTDEPVYAELENGKLQESSAFSQWVNNKPSITLNGSLQSDFNLAKATNTIIMSALGLHELAVLTGVEKTGDYHVTQRFLGAKKIICPDPIGICGPATYTTVFYEFKYESAQYIPAENDLKIVGPYYVSSEPVDGQTTFMINSLYAYDNSSNLGSVAGGAYFDTFNIICNYFGQQFIFAKSYFEPGPKVWTILHKNSRKELSDKWSSKWVRFQLSDFSYFGDNEFRAYTSELHCTSSDTVEKK
jgi:hypothetical protein